MATGTPNDDSAKSEGAKTEVSKPDGREAPKAVVNRLSLYLRELQRLVRDEQETVSSNQLGQLLGFTDAQVRKDLAYFGPFGHPGVGYRCVELVAAIKSILGTDRQWTVALVGVGNLGRALLGYRGFQSQGFQIVAAFDADMAKVGQSLAGVIVHPLDRLEAVVREKGVTLGLIASPADAAQEIADRLVAAGVAGILNFAPVTLSLPAGVSLVGVDLATEMEQLTYSVARVLAESPEAVAGPPSEQPDSEEPPAASERPEIGPAESAWDAGG
ncbi:Redox-sensing transcriptional repressor Rex [Botrimarina hoheduenensis]|uniref:Redox-sensing transcriptional repressor Rex n=1 Tax=Botrimarina hoheduenensis TaxID=2528000 RepID=A0A5C5WC08_9BACT|nr:Redox-sensing transcriptional repressor Rex [Botrimarina hoheduenensis]